MLLYFQIEMLYNYSMKGNIGYIKETELNYFDDEQSNNIIDVNDINDNYEYIQQQNQVTDNQADTFDYTLLKIICFLIFI